MEEKLSAEEGERKMRHLERARLDLWDQAFRRKVAELKASGVKFPYLQVLDHLPPRPSE